MSLTDWLRLQATVVISLDNLHELLHICATFRSGTYRSKVLSLLKPGNPTLPRLFAMARVVAQSVIHKQQPFPPPGKGENVLNLPVFSLYRCLRGENGWYFGEVQQQSDQHYSVHYYGDDST